ncbi:MAG TPA: hypothetical protein VHD83_11445 [Puia sp.]|nr:hypothetical protein [Puia sp.]
MKLLLLTPLLALMLAAHSQTVIRPGDASIHYEWLVPSHDFYKVVVFDSVGHHLMEFMNEQVQVIDTGNGTILSVRVRQAPFGRLMRDSSICTSHLTPLRMHEFDEPKTFEHDFRFAGREAYVSEFKKGVLKKDTFNMEEGYFDENSVEGFFACMTFEMGHVYRINAFRIGHPGTINAYEMEYVFDDTRGQTGDNDLNCKVLRFKNAYSNGYIWVDVQRHKMVKEYIQMDSGKKVVIVEK